MIHVRPHGSQDYAARPDIDASNAGTLTADDRACLDEVGRCFVAERVSQRFGAVLLHSHFPVGDDEILVEEAHADAQLIMLRPIAGTSTGLVVTSICFEGSRGSGGLIGLEFAAESALGGVRPLGGQDHDVFVQLQEILRRHGKLGRFGVRLLHDPLALGGRVLLETCDPISRILTSRVTTEDDPTFAEAVPTLFQWEAAWPDSSLTASQGCMQFCKSIRKCASSRSGHQHSSSHETSHDDRF